MNNVKRVTAALVVATATAIATPNITATAAPSHRSTSAQVMDRTINDRGVRKRVTVRKYITWDHDAAGNWRKSTDFTVRIVRTKGPLPKQLPWCVYEDASGDRDRAYGCRYQQSRFAGALFALPVQKDLMLYVTANEAEVNYLAH